MPQKYSKPVYERDVPWQVYDLAIIAAAALFVAAALALTPWFLAPLVVLLYGSFVEPRILTVKRYDIGAGDPASPKGLRGASRKLTIAYLSDIHVGPYKGKSWVARVVARTNALRPDLVLLGGDFLCREGADAPELEPLENLKAPLGVYGILGNHDEWKPGAPEAAKAQFAKMDIPLLLNRTVRFEHDGVGVAIAGVEDDWHADTDFAAALREALPDDALIMMIHNPDLAPHAAKFKPRLMLSGHTHGGQIRLPFFGAVPRLPHWLGRRYDRGAFFFDGSPLIISQGLGESGPRARLFCPPQIVLVTLRF